MGKFGDIANRIAEIGGAGPSGRLNQSRLNQERVMEFSPVKDGENVALWRDLENVRYKQDGIREDIRLRGGTKQGLDIGEEDVISMYAFQSSYEGDTYEYLAQWKDDALRVVNLTTETSTLYGDTSTLGFDLTNELQYVVNGRFLYLFQFNTGVAHYIDLKNKTIHKWMGSRSQRITGYEWVDDGDYREGNVWGMDEGSSIYVYKNNLIWNQITIPTIEALQTLSPGISGIYKYTYNSGKYAVIDGKEYKSDFIFQISRLVDITISGSGTDFVLEHATGIYSIPVVNGEIDYSPQIAKITELEENEEIFPDMYVNLRTTSPWDGGGLVVNNTFSSVSFIPAGVDIQPVLEKAGVYKLNDDETDIILNDNWSAPTLHRIYTICYELNDGSVTHPSIPIEVSTSTNDLMLDDDLQRRGIRLSHYNSAADVPKNAVRGYLFCTRWQLSEADCFGTSDDYPNGPLYFCQTFSVNDEWIYDFTPDRKLNQTISSYLPFTDGKPTTMPAKSVVPKSVAPVKGSIIVSGYRLKRPLPTVSNTVYGDENIFFKRTGSAVANLYLDIVFEYSDGTKSRAASEHNSDAALAIYDTLNEFRLQTLPALVEKVYVYIENRSTDTYYLVKEITDTDKEWFGLPLSVDSGTGNYSSVTLNAGTVDNEELDLFNYVAFGTPPQMIDISSQKQLTGVDEIRRIHASQIDERRGDQLRYLMYVLTNKNPVIGYLNANIDDGGFVFDVITEPIPQFTPLLTLTSSAEFMNGVLFHTVDGVYLWQGKKLTKILDNSRYDVLQNPLIGAAWHSRETELWFLGAGNKVIVFDVPDAGDLDTPFTYLMDYSGDTAKSFKTITALGDQIYGSFDTELYELDALSHYTDDFKTANQRISGLLTSDYLTGSFEQLYLDVIEILGKGISCKVEADLQNTRFDDGDADNWSVAFTSDVSKNTVEITMQGVIRELYSRGVQPRIRLTVDVPAELQGLGDHRLSAARLWYKPVEHEGVARL